MHEISSRKLRVKHLRTALGRCSLAAKALQKTYENRRRRNAVTVSYCRKFVAIFDTKKLYDDIARSSAELPQR